MIRFIKRAGRIIPIRTAGKFIQGELQNIKEVAKVRSMMRAGGQDSFGGVFLKTAQIRSKATGQAIAKRISRFKKKGIL